MSHKCGHTQQMIWTHLEENKTSRGVMVCLYKTLLVMLSGSTWKHVQ